MKFNELVEKIPKDIRGFARFVVDLEHNSNFFSLDKSIHGLPAFKRWWEENSPAYLISLMSVQGYDVHVYLVPIEE